MERTILPTPGNRIFCDLGSFVVDVELEYDEPTDERSALINARIVWMLVPHKPSMSP